jgi:hypothetical protein
VDHTEREASVPDATPLPYVGACFGYSLRSNAPLAYARTGEGPALELDVTSVTPVPSDAEPVMTFHSPTPDRTVTGHVYTDGADRYRVWVDGGGWYTVDVPAGRVELPSTTPAIAREEALWGVPGRILLVERGDLPLHAGAVEVDGRALVFSAPTRHGKTTLAALLTAAGFRLLSEDLVDVQFTPAPVVVPGPAFLRLRRDVLELVDVPGTTVVAESAGRAHLAIDPSLRGTCDPLPVAAVVLLRTGDRVTVTSTDQADAIRDVWSQGFAMPTRRSRAQTFDNIGRLVSSVPVLDVSRPLRMDAVPRVIDALVDLVMARA